MNKRIKKRIAFVLACVMMLSLCACGKKSIPFSKGVKEGERTAWYLGGNNLFHKEVDPKTLFKDVPDSIDPAAVYASLELTEQMLQGVYGLNDPKKDIKTVLKEIPTETITLKSEPVDATVLPVAVYFGADYITGSGLLLTQYRQISDYPIAVLEFAAKNMPAQAVCTYEISANTVTFKQITQTSALHEDFAYEFTGLEFVYGINLCGPYLEFSKDEHTLQLKAYCVTKSGNEQLYMQGCSRLDSPLVDQLDYLSSSSVWNSAVKRDGSKYALSAYKFDDSGRFTVYLENEDASEIFVQQYAYILHSSANGILDTFSVTLLDEDKIYDYADSITQRETRVLEEQGVDVAALTVEDIETIAEKKADLFDDLYTAFRENGIKATINRSTGEIALDSTVLFEVNESKISGNGKVLLREFMQVYTSVVFSDEYEDFVSKILVEGHTDTSGSYELNQQLSLERASSVMTYCLSEDCGIAAEQISTLETMMEAVGYAYDKPVYDENGEVDMDASRRVAFRFFVNVKN